jgi:hypothetical protein
MNRRSSIFWIPCALAVTIAAGAAGAGCSDVGDSSAVPGGGEPAGADMAGGPSSNATVGEASDASADALGDAAGDHVSGEAAASDSSLADTGVREAAVAESSVPDASIHDAAGLDAGALDAAQDAGAGESGAPDTGAPEAASPQDGGADAGPDAAQAGDGGADSGLDAGASLHPCVVAGDTSCVQCQYNDLPPKGDMTCTPTEAAIVQHDIATGRSTRAGPSDPSSCYECLVNVGSCIDDTRFGDRGHECEDPLVTGTAAQCQATLACIFQEECAAAAVSICYCGTAGLLTTCQGNPAAGPIDGACAATIAAGLGFPVSDGTDNTAQLTSATAASGKADQIFQCALTNGCAACQ